MSSSTTIGILAVAARGNLLVSTTTKYLSTLPHPIEIVEELIAVVSVTCSLLSTLHTTIQRFTSINLSTKKSFLSPLEADLRFAFDSLEKVILEAKNKKLFEPNDVGLVRVPRNAWGLVCGGEAQAGMLRSRLYVEKYRVRVLIDAVCWVGLNRMVTEERSASEEQELKELRMMLPLVAERLVGVQRDYVPRLTGKPIVEEEKIIEIKPEEKKEVAKVEEKQVLPPPVTQPSLKAQLQEWSEKPKLGGKKSFHSSSSTDSWTSSCSSSRYFTIPNLSPRYQSRNKNLTITSITEVDNSISEVWVLRRNEATETLTTKRSIFRVPVSKKTTVKPASYYVKPLASTPSEIELYVQESMSVYSARDSAAHEKAFKKQICKLDEDGQWEVQKLLEARDKSSSTKTVKRNWEVVAFIPKPRRKFCVEQKSRWFKPEDKNSRKEWVFVIRGDTVDCKTRTTPDKKSDPWAPIPVPKPVVKPIVQAPPPQAIAQQQAQAQIQQRQAMAPVLRHVETRKGLSAEEAEKKMEEIVKDLFVSVDES